MKQDIFCLTSLPLYFFGVVVVDGLIYVGTKLPEICMKSEAEAL